jgi:hypothetical protein
MCVSLLVFRAAFDGPCLSDSLLTVDRMIAGLILGVALTVALFVFGRRMLRRSSAGAHSHPTFVVNVEFEDRTEGAAYPGKLTITPWKHPLGWKIRMVRGDNRHAAVLTLDEAIAYHQGLERIIRYCEWRRR